MTRNQLEARYNARRRAKEALRPELSNNELHALTCSALAETHGPEIRDLAERTNDPMAVHIVSHWGTKIADRDKSETEEKLK